MENAITGGRILGDDDVATDGTDSDSLNALVARVDLVWVGETRRGVSEHRHDALLTLTRGDQSRARVDPCGILRVVRHRVRIDGVRICGGESTPHPHIVYDGKRFLHA